MTNRYDSSAFEYTEAERLRKELVGRSIIHTVAEGSNEMYNKVITYVLDDGTLLRAHATDGGCGCSNGCFTVDTGLTTTGTILNVEVEEYAEEYNYETGKYESGSIQPGSISDGSSTIKIFVYTELGPAELVESQGGDNGYYGWGFWLDVVKPVDNGS